MSLYSKKLPPCIQSPGSDEEHLSLIKISVEKKWFKLYGSNGSEDEIFCDTKEQFMRVMNTVKTIAKKKYIIYV